MDFTLSERQLHWQARVADFMAAHVEPAVERYEAELAGENGRWHSPPVIQELKQKAQSAGLWNLFMPPAAHYAARDSGFEFEGPGLTNLEYALCAEEMGRLLFAPEIFNCSPPDTGNMEVLYRYGTDEQKESWLRPLMRGEIRSAFLMTEPAVASSDATNIETTIRRDGDHYVINGHKWWSSGAGDPRCKVAIVMGKTNPEAGRRSQQSQILVPLDTPGVQIVRMLRVFGFDEAPKGHGEIILKDVRVPVANIIGGEGRGFEVAQGRLGPGRIHHCMRAIGAAEAALEIMIERLTSRTAFGKKIVQHSPWPQRIADARLDIEMTRLLCLQAADMMDRFGNEAARLQIAMTKVAAPRTALKIIDDAIQASGAAGLGSDLRLSRLFAKIRTLRIADGPDEVHCRTIARSELARQEEKKARRERLNQAGPYSPVPALSG